MIRYGTMLAVLACIFTSTTQAQFENGFGDRSHARRLLAETPKLATTSSHVPSLVVEESDGNLRPLELNRYELSVRILDFLVETTATYTFHNPKSEQVEGVFEFPLPEGVTVDGYALDVNSELIDGVALPRERATFVFDTIEKRGIDPGLVEQTGQNAFRSRIFPIPGHGERTIRIRYTDRITSSTYTVPTTFDGTIAEYSVDIEAKGVPSSPKVAAGGFSDIEFKDESTERSKIFRAKVEGENFKPTENLVLELPGLDEQKIRIVTGNSVDKKGRHEEYFVLRYPMAEVRKRLEPKRLEREKALQTPKRIAVYWDASGSRADIDHAKEIELLQKYLAEKQCSVELYFFRDTMEPAGVYETGNYEKLFDRIANVPYDGGTSFFVLETVKHSPDLALLFSDVRNTLDLDEMKTKDDPFEESLIYAYFHQHPTYIILAGATEKDALTRYLGEQCFDLSTMSPDEIIKEIGNVSLRIMSYSVTQGLFHINIELDDDWLWISGLPSWNIHDSKRETPKLEINLCLGGQARAEKLIVPIEFDFGNMWLSEIPKRFYAQRRLQQLFHAALDRDDDIRKHGLKYGLVTPETSLIVLESLDQYVEFQVEPPACKPEWRQDYQKKKTAWQKQVKEAERKWTNAASTYLKRDWDNVIRWWEHSFDVLEGFKYVPRYDSRSEAFGLPRDRHDAFFTPYSPYRRYNARNSWNGGWGGGFFGGMGGMGGGFGGAGGFFSSQKRPVASDDVLVRIDPPSNARKSPYLAPIREAAKRSPDEAYAVYLDQRKQYARSPLFYWESAILFMEFEQEKLAFRILRNIPELGLDDDLTFCRMLGYLMLQWNRFRMAEARFGKALKIDPNDFASLRGEALAHSLNKKYREANYFKARGPFDKLIDKQWDAYTKRRQGYFSYDAGFQLVAAVERRHNAATGERNESDDERKKAAARPLDVDLRVVAVASHKNIDIALSVTEPTGERLDRDHALSVHGGALDGAYATEDYPALSQYMIRRAPKGKYKIVIERFDILEKLIEEADDAMVEDFEDCDEDLAETTVGVEEPEPVKEKGVRLLPGVVFVDIFTNYGRPDETRRSVCITLDDETEVYQVGEVEW